MDWSIESQPAFSVLKVKLSSGEKITSEPGAYLLHKGDIRVKTGAKGGVFSALARKIAGGESIFMNDIIAESSGTEVWFAPSVPGDIKYITVSPENPVYVQDSSFLAMHGDVKLTVAWRGIKGLIAEGELFWLKLEGNGGVWVNSYGAMSEIPLNVNERIVVDNGHLVAMTGSLSWKVRKFGGLKSFVFGGEGFVMEIVGPGNVLVQTRTLPSLASALVPFLPKK